MNEDAKRLLKIEALVVALTVLFTVFLRYNSTTKVMNSSCEDVKNERRVNCD